MIVVIIAGGSGSRLWPLSTPDYPKHLLKIGGSESTLLQSTYARAKHLAKTIYVVTDKSHAHHVREQLTELPEEAFIVEPARRGTANCILTTLAYIAGRHDSKEPIAYMPADHHIRDIKSFAHSFKIANTVAQKEQRLVLVGVEPDYPATGFGYIKKGELLSEPLYVFGVDRFEEKPSYVNAQKYLQSGNYLWNCGYFVGTHDSFVQAMQRDAPDLFSSYQTLVGASEDAYVDTYLQLENAAIDYALMEKVQDLLVVPAAFDWMDLGSYTDLAKAVGADERGNYIQGTAVQTDEIQNTYVENHEEKPLIVIGLDNCVIINSPHGILVTRKDLSQKVGDASKRLGNK